MAETILLRETFADSTPMMGRRVTLHSLHRMKALFNGFPTQIRHSYIFGPTFLRPPTLQPCVCGRCPYVLFFSHNGDVGALLYTDTILTKWQYEWTPAASTRLWGKVP